jgi:serine/threonine protein kinase
MTVSRASLGRLTFLAEGGFGRVYRVDDFRLPGDPAPLAFKEFTVRQAEQATATGKVVEFRARLSPTDRAELDSFSAWPLDRVSGASGDICGLLMHLIPPEFFCHAADAETGQVGSQPRNIMWLMSSNKQRQEALSDVPDIGLLDRLYLLSELSYALAWLHRRGWVFGDLSFGNVVFALDPPRVLLIDCDGAARLADTTRQQASTPYWDPPEVALQPDPGVAQQGLQDDVTDAYKLGLAILRCLKPGKGAATTREVTRLTDDLDAAGFSLVSRALAAGRSERPTARELYLYLRQAVLAILTPPEVLTARLATPFCVRGLDARVEWQIANATRITLRAGYRFSVDLVPAQHPHGYVFRPDESGPVSVTAANRHGTVTADLGELNLYELPPFQLDLGSLPRLELPNLGAFTVPAAAAALAGRPAVPLGITGVAGLPPVPTAQFTGSPVPMTWSPPPWPRVDAALTGAWQAVSAELSAGAEDLLTRLRQAAADAAARRAGP